MEAAIIGLAGVALGVVAGFATTWLTLFHDSKQRKLEREMDLRREVYLEAAGGLAEAQFFLGRFAQPEFKPDQDSGLTGSKIGWYNKVQLVASIETFEAFAEGEARFQAALAGLIPIRYEFDQVQLRLQAVQSRKDQLTKYQQVLHSGAQSFLAQGAPTGVNLHDFYAGIQLTQAQIDELAGQEANLLTEKADRQRALLLEVNRRSAELRRSMAEAVVALRQELSLPIEKDRYHAAIDNVVNESEAHWRKLLGDEPEDSTNDSESGASS